MKTSQHDIEMRDRRPLEMPTPESLERGRKFFAKQSKECFALAQTYPEMLAAAEKFKRWSTLPDEELANHWPLSRARTLWNRAVRDEMRRGRK